MVQPFGDAYESKTGKFITPGRAGLPLGLRNKVRLSTIQC